MMGKAEEKGPLGRPRSRWQDNIKMKLKLREWKGVDWIDLVQDGGRWRTVVKMLTNIWVLYNMGKSLTS